VLATEIVEVEVGGVWRKIECRSFCSIKACDSLLPETQRLFLFVPPTLLLLASVFALMLLLIARKRGRQNKEGERAIPPSATHACSFAR
jgi:hypothetical protein